MQKIGIVTHYYRSMNYGGNLQAWALCEICRKLGCNAEQIAVKKNTSLKDKCASLLHGLLSMLHPDVYFGLQKRKLAILEFNSNAIPHTKKYTENQMKLLEDAYDIVITGSDQVWHPSAVCDAYLLTFTDGTKTYKMSYAASISSDSLSEEVQNRYSRAIADYSAISVREKQAITLLAPITPLDVKWVLDPVLLFEKEEWLALSSNRFDNEKFLLCFFLGADSHHRTVAEAYARERGMKLYTLPHLLGKYRKCDKGFGDRHLYDVSPQDLLSLIKNAQFVFTDSFHVSAFSILFEKPFVVFGRGNMSSRIYNLLEAFHLQSRFCDTKDKTNVNYIASLSDMDYADHKSDYQRLKAESIDYLRQNFQRAQKADQTMDK